MSDHSFLRDAQLAAARLDTHDQQRADLQHERDEAIRLAHESEGATIAELSRTTGLSRTILYRILDPK